MKKILLLTVALAGMVGNSFGQGEVFFANSAAAGTKIYASSNGVASSDQSAGILNGALIGGGAGAYQFALFSAAQGTSLSGSVLNAAGWSFTGFYAANTATAGRIASAGPFGPGGGTQIPGIGVGSTAALVVVGWDTAHGGSTLASYQTALSSQTLGLFSGQSSVANILLGNGSTPPDSFLFGTGSGQIGGFTLAATVPEPATFALAGLGMAAMLVARRRK